MVIAGLVLACDRQRAQEPEPRPAPPAIAARPSASAPSASLRRTAPARIVAVGDLHGDLDHARRAFRLAGAIDANDRWIGGALVVVQTGDEVDRGDDDRAVLDAVERWRAAAEAAGGDVLALLGNHELMNASADFRYVTLPAAKAFASFDDGGSPQRGRANAFAPGGSYARLLGHRPVVVQLGDTVFVHGGILPSHVRLGLARINAEVDAWLEGTSGPTPPAAAVAEDGPLWTRLYSQDTDARACVLLDEALTMLDAKRMVVGHTVQPNGITGACDDHVWRIDVGMSHVFGGPVQALQIEGDQVAVLREP